MKNSLDLSFTVCLSVFPPVSPCSAFCNNVRIDNTFKYATEVGYNMLSIENSRCSICDLFTYAPKKFIIHSNINNSVPIIVQAVVYQIIYLLCIKILLQNYNISFSLFCCKLHYKYIKLSLRHQLVYDKIVSARRMTGSTRWRGLPKG